jgi:hypothetical protein
MAAPATTGTGAEPEPDVPVVSQLEPALAAPQDEEQHEDQYEDQAPERRMSPLAVIAMIVAILVIAGGVGAVLTHGFRQKTKLAYQVPAVFKLRPGDCFNSGQNGINLTLRSCSTPHDAEVFATFPVIASSWPGDAALQAEAQSGCTSRVAGYMNLALATNALDQEYIYPDKVAWRAGIRSIICDVRSSVGPITGSVRQGS